MVTLRFELLAGRLHATPWDAHVNEGQVEWPPSPWRILRALVAASFRLPDRDPDAVKALILKLADGLPSYRLPAVTLTHTRAYLTQGRGTDGKLVFDAFAVADRAGDAPPTVEVTWTDVTLQDAERALLRRIVEQVGYLGRAESWVEVHVADAPSGPPHARPLSNDNADPDVVTLWAAATADGFEAWRQGFLDGGGRSKDAPPDRYAALCMETPQLHKERWSSPPGSRRVRYTVDAPDAVRAPRAARRTEAPVAARFALTGTVLPSVTRTLIIAERLRKALMARSRTDGVALPVFSGKDAAGVPLQGNQHALFLPTDDDGDGRIDHLLVWCFGGFDRAALRALHALDHLWAEEGFAEQGRYHVQLLALGDAAALGVEDPSGPLYQRTSRDATRTAALGWSRRWRTETPFVPYRHPKRRADGWHDLPAEQVLRALHHLPNLAGQDAPEIRLFDEHPDHDPEQATRWSRTFVRTRLSGGGSLGSTRARGVELTFDEPVRGPLVVGYGAHFGLGMFRAVESP